MCRKGLWWVNRDILQPKAYTKNSLQTDIWHITPYPMHCNLSHFTTTSLSTGQEGFFLDAKPHQLQCPKSSLITASASRVWVYSMEQNICKLSFRFRKCCLSSANCFCSLKLPLRGRKEEIEAQAILSEIFWRMLVITKIGEESFRWV